MKAYAHVVDSYSRQAPRYDARWRRYSDATIRATLDAVPWKNLQQILDVGCGTGLLEQAARSRSIAPSCFVGVDVSLPMLQQARRKFSAANHLCWANAVAENLPFPDDSFDAVVCVNSFHYFRQPREVLKEFRRVLQPNGWLVLTDWCDDYLACKICDWVLRVVDRAHFRMYGLKQCEELLTKAGFRVKLARRFKIDWLWGLMTYQARA